jgi:hypothetical protein
MTEFLSHRKSGEAIRRELKSDGVDPNKVQLAHISHSSPIAVWPFRWSTGRSWLISEIEEQHARALHFDWNRGLLPDVSRQRCEMGTRIRTLYGQLLNDPIHQNLLPKEKYF